MIIRNTLNTLNKIISPVAKYVTPTLKTKTLRELGLKMEQSTGDIVELKNCLTVPSEAKLKQLMEKAGIKEKTKFMEQAVK